MTGSDTVLKEKIVMDRWGTVGGPLAARDPACI
jgi:hypothetical protein